MKNAIDLERAATGEIVGALAIGRIGKHQALRNGRDQSLTPAQSRAVSELLRHLLFVAKEAGASARRVKFGRVSLRLRARGAEEVLSIRPV